MFTMKKIGLIISLLFVSIVSFSQATEYWDRQNDVRYDFRKAVRYSGDIRDTLTTSQNNYNPTGFSNASIVRLVPTSEVNITGISGGSDGRSIFFINAGTKKVVFVAESSSSTAANRLTLTGDLVLQPKDVIEFRYDNVSSRWRAVTNRIAGEEMIGKLLSANLNVTTDQTIPIVNASKYVITKIVITNASANLSAGSTAGGVYPSASKAGTAIVANSQTYTALSASTKFASLTLASVTTTDVYTSANIYFSLTTAFGSACTADIYVYGYVLEQ